jgi:hypothetical protein
LQPAFASTRLTGIDLGRLGQCDVLRAPAHAEGGDHRCAGADLIASLTFCL